MASCVGLNGSVPIEEILSGNSESHIKWQRYLKTVFISAADNTYLYRFLTDDEPNSKKKCGKRWVAIPINLNLAQLNLGDVFDIPIKTAGYHDQGKTQEVHFSDIWSDEDVAVCCSSPSFADDLTILRNYEICFPMQAALQGFHCSCHHRSRSACIHPSNLFFYEKVLSYTIMVPRRCPLGRARFFVLFMRHPH